MLAPSTQQHSKHHWGLTVKPFNSRINKYYECCRQKLIGNIQVHALYSAIILLCFTVATSRERQVSPFGHHQWRLHGLACRSDHHAAACQLNRINTWTLFLPPAQHLNSKHCNRKAHFNQHQTCDIPDYFSYLNWITLLLRSKSKVYHTPNIQSWFKSHFNAQFVAVSVELTQKHSNKWIIVHNY